ncbi:glycosyltransferase family 4 protein [Paraburkholderia sp.]|jgi:glycosyltransferase involved in cell wall biosynthesis|uniref:glycosyltransferase family 4 protein n=1 Tax=Paraburkholderia sp. TaxID=1926495 RepID=UPI002F408500
MSAPLDSLQIGMHWFGERPGGLDRMFKALVESLPAQGVNVRGLVAGSADVLRDSGGVVEAFAGAGERLHTRMWQARRHSLSLKRAQAPDVVATHFALYSVPTAGVFGRIPRVVHFHGPWADESAVEGRGRLSHVMRRAIERAVYRHASRHIVLSRAFGELLEHQYGVPESSIRIVPGCVETERFEVAQSRAEARALLDLPNDRPVVFCIRRLVARMGLEELIDAIYVARQSMPDILLVIAGKGPLEPALRAKIAARRLESHVRLAGFVPDEALPLWYRSAELSIVPTLTLEGFGLTTIESLAAGTPVLVTPVGGLPEAVAPLSPDLVMPSIGYQAIGSALVDALLGRRALPDASACQDYARTRFDRSVVAAQVAEVYREAVAQG